MRELAPIVFVFRFGVCSRFFVVHILLLFLKNFHMNDGFSSHRHLQICSITFANSLSELFVHLFLQEVLQIA